MINSKSSKESLTKKALEVLTPDESGYSRIVWIDEFVLYDERLKLGNGGSWCGDDRGLGLSYNIRRIKANDESFVKEKERLILAGYISNSGNSTIGVQLEGFKKNNKNQQIKKEISDELRKQKCSILSIGSQIEIDHKDGRKDDRNVIDTSKQSISDFQPLSKAANMAKRTHCKECKISGNRFDAKKLGYSVSQIIGSNEYKNSCVGCYWYDPIAFNKEISSSYVKKFEKNGIVLEIDEIGGILKIRIPLSSLVSLKLISEEVKLIVENSKVNEPIWVKNEESKEFRMKRVQ